MVSVMLYPCIFYVALLMDMLALCVACLTVCGYCGLSESELCVFGKSCPIGSIVCPCQLFCK